MDSNVFFIPKYRLDDHALYKVHTKKEDIVYSFKLNFNFYPHSRSMPFCQQTHHAQYQRQTNKQYYCSLVPQKRTSKTTASLSIIHIDTMPFIERNDSSMNTEYNKFIPCLNCELHNHIKVNHLKGLVIEKQDTSHSVSFPQKKKKDNFDLRTLIQTYSQD